MKSLYFVISTILLLFCSCGPATEELDQNTDPANCEQRLKQHWRQDSILLHTHEMLQDLLPESWGPSGATARTFGSNHLGNRQQYAEAGLALEKAPGFSFSYTLRDYSQDSLAIYQVWQEYLASGRGESPNPRVLQTRQLGGCAQAFVWEWYNGTERSIEAVLYGRYHLTITNHFSADSDASFELLQKGWKKIPWQKWEALGVEPVIFVF